MASDASTPAARPGFLHGVPRVFAALWTAVVVLTAGWIVYAFTGVGDVTIENWLVSALLLVLAVVFEEFAAGIARLQWQLSADLKRDMGSVWSIAAVVALPPTAAFVVITALLIHVWWRQQRPGGQPTYRAIYAGSTIITASLVAGCSARAVGAASGGLPWALGLSLAVLAAIVVSTVINRGLITLALIVLGARGRGLIGSADENLTEFSTLCLGGLVAIAALHEPWLCILAILPMTMLQRGSFVRELQTAAVTDPKTGLLNAVGWEHLTLRELRRARRADYPVSILIVDIDHFKRVNDRHGHLVGDLVLRGVARALGTALREYDGIGRFGGEEFVAVLPEAGELAAVEVAERIRTHINTVSIASVSSVDDDTCLSVSVGVATATPAQLAASDLTAMLVSADQALYRAKHLGRNRVCLAEDPDAKFEAPLQA